MQAPAVQLVSQLPLVSQWKVHRPPVQLNSQSASSSQRMSQAPPVHENVQLALPAQVIGQAPELHAAVQLPLSTHDSQSPVWQLASHVWSPPQAFEGSAGSPLGS